MLCFFMLVWYRSLFHGAFLMPRKQTRVGVGLETLRVNNTQRLWFLPPENVFFFYGSSAVNLRTHSFSSHLQEIGDVRSVSLRTQTYHRPLYNIWWWLRTRFRFGFWLRKAMCSLRLRLRLGLTSAYCSEAFHQCKPTVFEIVWLRLRY